MSSRTDYFGFELPIRGEYPGTWDVPINENFRVIDSILNALRNNHLAATGDPAAPVGSGWYSTVKNLLFVKTPSGFVRASEHTHDGVDTPKIDLTDGNQVMGKLPGHMIDSVTLDAGTLGGLAKDQFFRIPGVGLESLNLATVSLAKTGVVPGTYTKITIDDYGRAVFGSNAGTGLDAIPDLTVTTAPATYDEAKPIIEELTTKLNMALAALRAHGIILE